MSDHERWADAAGAYVLGAMPEDEVRAFEAHLAGCPECQAEVDELLPAAEMLPVSATPVSPPPALKQRIMAEVEREASLLRAAGSEADRPAAAPRRRRSWLGGWRFAPVAAAMLAAGALAGVGVVTLTADGARTVTATVDREQAPGTSARLRIEDGDAVLSARGMPAPPEGRVYQVWLMRPGSQDPEPTATLFMPRRDGTAVAAVPGDVSGYEAVLVTDEPLGGSEQPTRTPLLSVSPS
jgi:anti-sigma-K factor RskA